MPLVPSRLNATLLRCSQRDRAFEGAHGYFRASATLFRGQLGPTAKASRDRTFSREIVGDASGNRDHRECGARFLRDRDIYASAVGVEIERSAAVEPTREADVAGNRL